MKKCDKFVTSSYLYVALPWVAENNLEKMHIIFTFAVSKFMVHQARVPVTPTEVR